MNRVRHALSRGALPLIDLAFPAPCFVCHRRLGICASYEACLSCWTGMRPLVGPLCAACSRPATDVTDLEGRLGGRCAVCAGRGSSIDRARAAVAYGGAARAILLRAKLARRPELFLPLGAMVVAVARASAIGEGCDALVPVPSHPWRNLERGFCPARELARPVARALRLRVVRGLRRRWWPFGPAKRLGRAGRRRTAEAAFRVRGSWKGRRVLLIDDVMTTGATAEACAGLLRQAGAAEVRVLLWARTLAGAGLGGFDR